MYKVGFTDKNGKLVNINDTVYYSLIKQKGIVKNIFQDGDAAVKFAGGDVSLVKWIYLIKENKI